MKHTTTRLLSVLLAVLMAAGMLAIMPATVSATPQEVVPYAVTGGNIYFSKTTGEITKCDKSVTEANIPAEIDGIAVTEIMLNAFSGCRSLTTVTIPSSITFIGKEAFRYCVNLTSVTIPDSVTYIGYGAFSECHNLSSITLPDSLTKIGDSVFYKTAYYNDESNWENGVLYVGKYLIKAKESISSEYRIKSGTIRIVEDAFYKCTNLTGVTIPSSVTSIGWVAFSGCSSLKSVTIPDGVTSIGQQAFENCTSLTDVKIPDSVTVIGDKAFNNTAYYNDESNWENGVLYIGNSLIKADHSVIRGEYKIKDTTVCIANSAFFGCSSLTGVTIPDGVTIIGDSTFASCKGLKSVIIPDGVTSIRDYAFNGCGLTSVTIPDSVKSIGRNGFNNCRSLASITLPDSLTSLTDNAFSNTAYYNDESNWEDGALYIGKCLIHVKLSANGAYEIKDGTTCIGGAAFHSCKGLTSVTIPDGVKSIGYVTFYGCKNLTSVTIPSSVTSIESSAFDMCGNLSDINYGGSEEQWSKVTFGAYNDPVRKASVHYGSHTVSFNSNGGGGTMAKVTVKAGEKLTLPECAFTSPSADKVFDKWDVGMPGDKVDITSDCIITAVWTDAGEIKVDYIPGDVNGNGRIDSNDYALAKRSFLGTYELDSEELMRADIDGSGKLDSNEYAMIKRHCLGTYTIPGAEGK